ncbi:hypothetical protein [Rahnella laticis]|uniref:hypothetical protein n=1 Tax=Rahnella laticis TaxID=2787622 RepID=UPI0018A2E206|nr:hypothetical protein [Rahnella laticis]MBF7995139.1 hypothetical protein [Rahnella laticis]
MYKGYPDFQDIITTSTQRFIGTYQQKDAYFLYPESLGIQAADPLPFSLDIVRSSSAESIYGWLSFMTELQYASGQSLEDFKNRYPGKAVNILPLVSGSLGFDVPIEYHSDLRAQSFDATWYSAQYIQFIILLNSASTQLIENTILDKTIGFNARLDGFVEGVSPRLPYSVEFDPHALMQVLTDNVPGSVTADGSKVAFSYDSLTQYLYKNISKLPLKISPTLPENDLAAIRMFCQAFLDRLCNLMGSPCAGPADSNVAMICLASQPQSGRVIFTLDTVVLSLRPLSFLLDPFSAAKQIAKKSPDTIIHRITPPPMPEDKRAIDVFYTSPPGLDSSVSVDIQLTLPAGNIYPRKQTQTQRMTPDQSRLTFSFFNSSLAVSPFFYQIRVNYFQEEKWQTISGEQLQCADRFLVLDPTSLPCKFITLSLDESFARQSTIRGTYHSGGWGQRIELTQDAPDFSYPSLGESPNAEVEARQLSGDGVVPLPMPVTLSTTIGAYSFPQFGAQQAQITVNLPDGMTAAEFEFEPQSLMPPTKYTFTHLHNTFDYKWTVTSIFASGYRYRAKNGPWSAYVTGNQTIDFKG